MSEEKVMPIKYNVESRGEPEIGIDKEKALVSLLAKDEGLANAFDTNRINKFRDITDKREAIYKIFDLMGKDEVISSALEMYAEDSTEYNESGKVIWAESTKPEIANTVNYIIETLKLDQNAWQYMYYLVKYGDLYLETFRASDLEDKIGRRNLLKNSNSKKLNEDIAKNNTKLEEGVIVNMYGENDRLQEYIELVPNPAEVFDLIKRGKTVGFLRTKATTKQSANNSHQDMPLYQYNYNDVDIKLYDPTKYIHIYLPDTTSRELETVKLFNIDEQKASEELTYTVRRGKSILYDLYKVYREVSLLQDSILLNRITKSSLVRILQIEVGEMGKQQAHQVLQRIKSLFEQKMALNEGTGMSDYNNPGAIERNVYLQTRRGLGAITPVTLGGEFQAGQLTDLDYFNNKLFAALKIPKPFLGFMDDAAGFSGGQSLMRINSRYSKTIKRFKNAFMQGIKTLVNIFLLDRGLDTYVNNFNIKMQSPSTQEDAERVETQEAKLRIVNDVINLVKDAKDDPDMLSMSKILLSDIITNTDVLDEIQRMIDEAPSKEEDTPEENEDGFSDEESSTDMGEEDLTSNEFSGDDEFDNFELTSDDSDDSGAEESLPNPTDLNVDFTDNE